MWKWLHRQRRSTNQSTRQGQRLCMETLESRLLLNGDPIVDALNISPTPADEGQVVQLEVSFTDEATPGSWSTPTAVVGLSDPSVQELSPFVTSEGMYYAHNATIYFAENGTEEGTFVNAQELTGIANAGSVSMPWVSEAQDRMYYYYGSGATRQIYAAVRDEFGAWFNHFNTSGLHQDAIAETLKLANINSLGQVAHPGLTSDELQIVFAGYDLTVGSNTYDGWNIFMADRATTADDFDNIHALDNINGVMGAKMYPKITSDGLHVYFALDNQQVMVSTWDAQNNTFGTPTPVMGAVGDEAITPSLSADGQTLYVSKFDAAGNWGIYLSTQVVVTETHTAAIDWDGDGLTDETILDVSNSFTTQHAYEDNGAYDVTVTITDSSANSGSNSVLQHVNNVAPLILDLNTNATMNDEVASGETTTLSGTFTDPGKADTYTVTVNWGDESSSAVNAVRVDNTDTFIFSEDHTYIEGGIYTASVTVTDDDAGADMMDTESVIIGVGIQNRTLNIVGSNASEVITVQTLDVNTLQVDIRERVSGVSQTYLMDADVDQIHAYGRGGNDAISVSHGISKDTKLDGGMDDDLIFGGQGNDTILGGDGNDKLFGRAGNDTMSGGLGNDRIWATPVTTASTVATATTRFPAAWAWISSTVVAETILSGGAAMTTSSMAARVTTF